MSRHMQNLSHSLFIFFMFFKFTRLGASIGFDSRLCSLIPRLSRSVVNRAANRPVPPQNGSDMLPWNLTIHSQHSR